VGLLAFPLFLKAFVAMSESRASSLKQLLSLAWPIVLARATQSVVGFCDALMVAPLGETALAATVTGALNTFAFIILPFGTVFILQSFAAQLRGRGELSAIPRYAYYGLLLAAGSALLAALFIPLVPWTLSHTRYSPEVQQLMGDYISIRAWSVGAAVGAEAIANWYGGLGNTRLSMVVGVVTMVVNVIGNYLLIEPRFGLPGYGVVGAAWASTLATWLGFAVALLALLKYWGQEDLPRAPVRWQGLRLAEFKRVVRFGLPNGVNWFLEFSAFALFVNMVVTHLGTTALAAFNVMIQINSISFMPAFGLASAGAVLVGEAIGRRALHEVVGFVRLTATVAGIWMFSAGLINLLFPQQLMGLFAPDSGRQATELVRLGAAMLVLSSIWQLFDALGLTLSEALRAAGDTTWCMVARIILAWCFFVPGAWLAVIVYEGGVNALMVALMGYIGLLAVVLAFRFLAGNWKKIDLVGAEPNLIADGE
jgi:MATE family multidrug resistance protein